MPRVRNKINEYFTIVVLSKSDVAKLYSYVLPRTSGPHLCAIIVFGNCYQVPGEWLVSPALSYYVVHRILGKYTFYLINTNQIDTEQFIEYDILCVILLFNVHSILHDSWKYNLKDFKMFRNPITILRASPTIVCFNKNNIYINNRQ